MNTDNKQELLIEYWTKEDIADLENTQTFLDVGKIAKRVLERMPNNLAQLCGPMSTGGTGNLNDNLELFSKIIEKLKKQNTILFDQRKLENAIHRIRLKQGEKYNPLELLENIYEPLFKTGKITTTYFIHGWETSQGTKWEHEQSKKRGLNIKYLPEDFEKISVKID